MNSRLGFRVCFEKVVQHMQQRQHVLPAAAALRLADVADDHVADRFGSVRLMQEVAGKGRRRDFGEVLVLGDGKDFFLGQAAEADAIFQRNHLLNCLPSGPARLGARERPKFAQRCVSAHARHFVAMSAAPVPDARAAIGEGRELALAACVFQLRAANIAGAVFGGIGGAGAKKKDAQGRCYCYQAKHDFLQDYTIEIARRPTT